MQEKNPTTPIEKKPTELPATDKPVVPGQVDIGKKGGEAVPGDLGKKPVDTKI